MQKPSMFLGQKKEFKRIQPMLKIRSPISSSIKRGKDSKLSESLESFESLNLYSIKLGLIRDLITLSAKYETDYSTRARFSKILKISQSLRSLLEISEGQIMTDSKFRDKLSESLRKINEIEVKEKDRNDSNFEEEDSIKICTNISGVYCIAFITYNRSLTQFDLEIHAQHDCELHSYHLTHHIKAKVSELEQIIASLFLSRVYFDMYLDRVVLRYSEEQRKEEVIIGNIQGVLTKTCIYLTESETGFDVKVFTHSINIPKTELRIESLLEMRKSGKRYMVKRILEQHLSLIQGELSWKLSPWLIMKWLSRKTLSSMFRKNLMDRRDDLSKHDEIILSGKVTLKNSAVKVNMIFNNFLQKGRIFIQLGFTSILIREEDYEKDFKKMKKLQNVEICSVTMMKSLEFLEFLIRVSYD